MKNLNYKILISFLLIAFISTQAYAQKDTTQLEIGKKKMMIIDKKTQEENAIYNLEKGKETFEKEIKIAEKLIEKHQDMMKDIEAHIQVTFSDIDSDSNIVTDFKFDFDIDELDKEKIDQIKKELKEQLENIELHKNDVGKLHEDIEKHKALIEIHIKEKDAFEDGLLEIEEDIREIEEGLTDIDVELDELDEDHDFEHKKGKHKKRFNSHWAGFEIGVLNFLNANSGIASEEYLDFMRIIPEKSMSYSLNIMEFNVPISKYYFGFATGAGIEWNSLALDENINIIELDGVLDGDIVADKDFKKNKFNAAYITVPILFEVQIPVKKRKFFLGAGVTGSMRAWSKQKQKYIIDGRKYKDRKVDDFQLSSFRYGLTARLGYGNVGLFVNYSLVPLFKSGSGAPEMYPVMIGLHLVDF